MKFFGTRDKLIVALDRGEIRFLSWYKNADGSLATVGGSHGPGVFEVFSGADGGPRELISMSLNSDADNTGITIFKELLGSSKHLMKPAALNAGESLRYANGAFFTIDKFGLRKGLRGSFGDPQDAGDFNIIQIGSAPSIAGPAITLPAGKRTIATYSGPLDGDIVLPDPRLNLVEIKLDCASGSAAIFVDPSLPVENRKIRSFLHSSGMTFEIQSDDFTTNASIPLYSNGTNWVVGN